MKWGRILFWAKNLDMVRQNSGAGCREPMYTSTAGSSRTAGRDGQGTGRLQLMARKTPFNSVSAEEKDWQVMHIQAPHCPTPYRWIRQLFSGWRNTLFETSFCPLQPRSTSSTSVTLIQAKWCTHRPGTPVSALIFSQGQDHLRM